jgi:hypothetical protein
VSPEDCSEKIDIIDNYPDEPFERREKKHKN